MLTLNRIDVLAIARDAIRKTNVPLDSEVAKAFMGVIATADMVGFGATIDTSTGVSCPMRQAGLWPDSGAEDGVIEIAYAWDDEIALRFPRELSSTIEITD